MAIDKDFTHEQFIHDEIDQLNPLASIKIGKEKMGVNVLRVHPELLEEQLGGMAELNKVDAKQTKAIKVEYLEPIKKLINKIELANLQKKKRSLQVLERGLDALRQLHHDRRLCIRKYSKEFAEKSSIVLEVCLCYFSQNDEKMQQVIKRWCEESRNVLFLDTLAAEIEDKVDYVKEMQEIEELGKTSN